MQKRKCTNMEILNTKFEGLVKEVVDENKKRVANVVLCVTTFEEQSKIRDLELKKLLDLAIVGLKNDREEYTSNAKTELSDIMTTALTKLHTLVVSNASAEHAKTQGFTISNGLNIMTMNQSVVIMVQMLVEQQKHQSLVNQSRRMELAKVSRDIAKMRSDVSDCVNAIDNLTEMMVQSFKSL